ncbi:hypothetical protein WJX72_005190 [[Myrmecia] bisecta]|uniref:Uncharacterized protein n=1 Tax=[Myrmecia] bisecta TaxID=41462 RepID=A0AAW1PSC7_9CHLO
MKASSEHAEPSDCQALGIAVFDPPLPLLRQPVETSEGPVLAFASPEAEQRFQTRCQTEVEQRCMQGARNDEALVFAEPPVRCKLQGVASLPYGSDFFILVPFQAGRRQRPARRAMCRRA